MVFLGVPHQSGRRELVFCHRPPLGLRGAPRRLALRFWSETSPRWNPPVTPEDWSSRRSCRSLRPASACGWETGWPGSSDETPVACVDRSALVAVCTAAHVGSPNVFFEGKAGPYPVHVVIRPPEVIPGLAEISVRVEAAGVERVTALPIKWNAGRKGAPPPDVARLVRGETNLYSAQLWFMEGGAQSVELEITGSSGPGRVTVPVDAVARRVLAIPHGLGAALVMLGFLLLALLLSVVGASVRESTLTPGTNPDSRRRFWAVIAMTLGAVLLVVPALGRQVTGGTPKRQITATTGCIDPSRPSPKCAPKTAGVCFAWRSPT